MLLRDQIADLRGSRGPGSFKGKLSLIVQARADNHQRTLSSLSGYPNFVSDLSRFKATFSESTPASRTSEANAIDEYFGSILTGSRVSPGGPTTSIQMHLFDCFILILVGFVRCYTYRK